MSTCDAGGVHGKGGAIKQSHNKEAGIGLSGIDREQDMDSIGNDTNQRPGMRLELISG